jgi:hypothetical protein
MHPPLPEIPCSRILGGAAVFKRVHSRRWARFARQPVHIDSAHALCASAAGSDCGRLCPVSRAIEGIRCGVQLRGLAASAGGCGLGA